jgi:hypothetical protein
VPGDTEEEEEEHGEDLGDVILPEDLADHVRVPAREAVQGLAGPRTPARRRREGESLFAGGEEALSPSSTSATYRSQAGKRLAVPRLSPVASKEATPRAAAAPGTLHPPSKQYPRAQNGRAPEMRMTPSVPVTAVMMTSSRVCMMTM